jgi:hypothetical protein
MSAQRYTEDYSYLRDPANRSGAWWERFKLLPLDQDGRLYVTVGDEVRFRYEHYTNNNFGSAATEGYLRYRQMPYADLHLGPEVRVFAQAIVAYGVRSRPKNPFIDETGVEVLQGFVDWRIAAGSGSLTLRAGRQVLVYGSGRFINAGPNIRTSFDGGVASLEIAGWRVDALYARPVRPELHSFDDASDPSRRIWSVYATRTMRAHPHAGFDLYYIGYENDAARFVQGTGHELRHTFGTRLFGSRGPWFAETEAAFQTGRFDGGTIRAWALDVQGRWTFWNVRFAPWLGIRTGATSGDGDPGDRALGTFNAMFPEGGYFGESGVVGPGNLVYLDPAVGVALGAGWYAAADVSLLARQRVGDGLYGIDGLPVRPDGGSRARYIGTQAEAVVGWDATRTLGLYAAYSVLFPGQFIRNNPPARTVQFIGSHVQFRW